MKIAIVTDSNSGIFERQARKMGVYVVPMPFSINGQWLYEGVQLTAKDFYKAQAEGADITTSMPSPADVTGMWEKLLADHDEVVYIPMTSGLSGWRRITTAGCRWWTTSAFPSPSCSRCWTPNAWSSAALPAPR